MRIHVDDVDVVPGVHGGVRKDPEARADLDESSRLGEPVQQLHPPSLGRDGQRPVAPCGDRVGVLGVVASEICGNLRDEDRLTVPAPPIGEALVAESAVSILGRERLDRLATTESATRLHDRPC